MEIIYTTRTTGFERGKSYRNPAFFDGKPERGATSVVVEGDWPEIAKAYDAVGILADTNKPQRKQKAKFNPEQQQD